MDLSVKDVIDRLGGDQAVAAATGLARNSVCYWRVRGCIPIQYQDDLLRLARGVGESGITLELLVRLTGARKRRTPKAHHSSDQPQCVA